MKKIFLIRSIFLLAISGLILSSSTEMCNEEKTNLYEYGTVETSEDNLKNLFKNFPVFIENGNTIDFLSYQFMGTVKNKREAKKYVRKNFDDLIPVGWQMSYQYNDNNEPKMESKVRLDLQEMHETKAETKRMVKTISEEYVHIGDEVYQINYVYNLQKHVHYVFINSKNKKVMLKGNIFGIEIPVSHFEYIEKMKF